MLMRFTLIFLLLLGSRFILHAGIPATTLAKTLDSLNPTQRAVLYQYGTLRKNAGQAVADSFWMLRQPVLGAIDQERGALLAEELLQSARITYNLEKPSRLQALRGVFTTSRLLIGLAALIAVVAVIQLLSRYLPGFFSWLRTVLAPFIRWLFNPVALSWELLGLGILIVWLAPGIPEITIRTIIVHLGIFFIWSQLTAIHTRRYLFKDYSDEIINILESNNVTPVRAFVNVSLPALFTAAAIYWAKLRTGDPWYAYEVIVPVMICIFALPPLRSMERALTKVLFPFPAPVLRTKDQRMIAYAVISLLVWMIMVAVPVRIPESLLVLSIFLVCMLLVLSIEDVTRCGIKNFVWTQVITVSFLLAVILTGAQYADIALTWTGLGGLLLFVLIKYWEIPVLLGWSWKNKKAWGALGMAVLIWGIAMLLRNNAEWFVFIK
ncbi:hypothetical protein CTE07_04710 [Chitinophaga terrae (ex Kim and Jung 2007)]|nr:hypothetical protein CTE07_04710 [Chitinophaga terrae (ex Kim and Jung 2007)]